MPEPVRRADMRSREVVRKWIQEEKQRRGQSCDDEDDEDDGGGEGDKGDDGKTDEEEPHYGVPGTIAENDGL